MPRFQSTNDEPPQPPRTSPAAGGPAPTHRLNVLLSYGDWREGSVVDQLPQLLAPMGIRSIRISCCDQAAEVIESQPIHIAVVDLAIPLHLASATSPASPGGARILQLLRRLEQPPPTVVVRPPQPIARDNVRGLFDALREGAFAVVDRPTDIETLLEVMRRVLRRYYADLWPS